MTQTREKSASINARMRAMFARNPNTPMTARVIRNVLGLPPDTAITPRIREIRNHPTDPMNIPCERVKVMGDVLYQYTFYPGKTVFPDYSEPLPF